MNRLPLLLSILLFSSCASPRSSFTKRSNEIQNFTLRTRGESGQRFVAKLKVDGVDRELSGDSPAEFPISACVLTGTIRKIHGDGTLGFQILTGNSTLTFASLSAAGDECQFRYHANGIEVWK